MPYKNIHFIKIMLELFDDDRFMQECNDSQKLDYILWIAMAGLTQNESKEDPQWFKTRFNLTKEVDEIRSNLCFLLKTFPKMYRQPRNGKTYIKFKKFKKLHNQIRIAQEYPQDSQRSAQNRIDKNRIDKIIDTLIERKGWDKNNKELVKSIYKRHCKPAKELLLLINNDDYTKRAINWVADMCRNRGLNWTLETVIGWLPDFIKKYPPEDKTPKEFKDLAKGIGCIK